MCSFPPSAESNMPAVRCQTSAATVLEEEVQLLRALLSCNKPFCKVIYFPKRKHSLVGPMGPTTTKELLRMPAKPQATLSTHDKLMAKVTHDEGMLQPADDQNTKE